jgi:hypothetical protein
MDAAAPTCHPAAMDDMDPDQLGTMNALEKLRFMASISAKQAKAKGDFAAAKAEVKAYALELGSLLFDLQDGELVWQGHAVECLMAERPATDDDAEDDTSDDGASGLWPVNVEVELLARIRRHEFDLDEVLAEHIAEIEEDGGLLVATPAQLPGNEWFAVMTATDIDNEKARTFVFALDRQA